MEETSDYIPEGSPTLLYAELLPNIRQISVIASIDGSLRTSRHVSEDTHAELTEDGTAFRLSHNNVDAELLLPAAAVPETPLAVPKVGDREASWRLPLIDPAIKRTDYFGQDNIAPWSATSLLKGQDFSCRNCKTLIVKGDVIHDWRDLPSENWAEMMDFWHCHKPHDHKHNGENGENGHDEDKLAEKGYGANTKFEARKGTGFVDLTYLLLSDEDCENIMNDTATKSLKCLACEHPLGHPDPLAGGYGLSKWSLTSSQTAPSPPTIPQLLSSTLLYFSTSQNIKKFLIRSPSPKFSLDLWLFAPLVTFSSSTAHKSYEPTTAIKLFYHVLGEEETAKKRETLSDSVEEIEVPEFVVDELLRELKQSTLMLPLSARTVQGWIVGLLERYVVDKIEEPATKRLSTRPTKRRK